MPNDSSLVGEFNLNTQAGVMAVLAAIRASGITAAEKNELRDLVFAYTNGGGDASVRIALEQKLTAHQIHTVVQRPNGAAAPVLPFGTYRPTPSFKAPATVAAPPIPPTTAPSAAVVAPSTPPPQSVPAPMPPVVPTPGVQPAVPLPNEMVAAQSPIMPPVSVPQPVAPYVAPAPAAVPASAQPVVMPASGVATTAPVYQPFPQPQYIAPQPVVASAAPVAPTTPQVIPTVQYASAPVPPAPAPSAVPIPPPTPAVPTADGQEAVYLERIKQIKYAVNSKVGNPVNLVDIDNQIGREYMNALLEAMKKLGSGAVSEMGPVMQRLEAAFVAVQGAIERHEASATVAASVPAQAPVPPPPPVQSEPVPQVLPEPPQSPVSIVAAAANDSEPVTAPSIELADVPEPPSQPLQITENAPVAFSRFEVQSETPQSVPQPVSLSATPAIKTPQDLPDPASLSTSASGDPYYTKEVDDGLEQLLSDWSLFKKSGLFGTGPRGRQHPLFKKIAEVQVPLILAGRFEGATQEIRQSITDYMNGWRYEQGIVYQSGETFEKYLRRVIRHILDLQKKQRGT